MKEYLKAFLAGLGCTPMLAVSLFVVGAVVSQFFSIYLPPPPQWLLVLAGVFPLCLSLFIRATISQREAPDWLELWRGLHQYQQTDLGSRRISVEDFWVQAQGASASKGHPFKRLLDNEKWWGWCAIIAGLPLAYVCLWFGLVNATGR